MIDVKDIPAEMKDAILKELPNSVKYRSVMIERDNAIKKKDYISALKYGKIMKSIESIALRQFAERLEYQQMSVKDIMESMTSEEREATNRKLFSIAFLSDMIETFCLDVLDNVRKVDRSIEIQTLDEVKELGSKLGAICRRMVGNDTFGVMFADYADDISKLVDNKVKSMLRKSLYEEKRRNES